MDEETPLVDVVVKDDEKEWWCYWKEEWHHMWELMIPVIGTYLLEILPGIVTIILVGFFFGEEKEYLDAASLATMMMNVFGLSIGFGLATAMDTLCSQEHGRRSNQSSSTDDDDADDDDDAGIMITYLQTGMYVLGIIFFGFVLWVHLYTGTILEYMGLPPNVCLLAGQYTQILVAGIPFLYFYELLRKTLQAQNNVRPMFVAALAANIFHIIMGILLIKSPLGIYGPAVARLLCSISYPLFLCMAMNTTTTKTKKYNIIVTKELFQFSSSSKQQNNNKLVVSEFLSLGIPGMLQLCLEWWSFELLAFIAGLLPRPELEIGINTIIMSIGSFVYMFYLGVGVSANVCVGNALGANQMERAHVVCQVSYTYSILISVCMASTLLLTQRYIPHIFTSDPELIDECFRSKVLIVAAIFQVFDAMGACVQGILRGSGQQYYGAIYGFIAYLGVGITSGIYLAFHFHLQVTGLWIGMTCALFTIATLGTLHIFYFSPIYTKTTTNTTTDQHNTNSK